MVYLRSEDEIKKISMSCQIVADTLKMIKNYVRPGVKVSKLDSMAEDFILSRGARPAFKGYMGFPSTLCVSIDSAVVHGIPGEDILEDGQIVGIDCGAADVEITSSLLIKPCTRLRNKFKSCFSSPSPRKSHLFRTKKTFLPIEKDRPRKIQSIYF